MLYETVAEIVILIPHPPRPPLLVHVCTQVNGSKDKGLSINTLTSRDAKSGKRHLVLVVPDKFRDHAYLSTLEALVTSDRRVVLYDAMGNRLSQPKVYRPHSTQS